jgi:hypothetical protein
MFFNHPFIITHILCGMKEVVVVMAHIVLKERKEVRKAIIPTGSGAESMRLSDRQLVREILDRRYEVSVILS